MFEKNLEIALRLSNLKDLLNMPQCFLPVNTLLQYTFQNITFLF